ncbi:hypothetical protein PFISCL1PPCAC_5922, partial [Pristionchus fissidentatus]
SLLTVFILPIVSSLSSMHSSDQPDPRYQYPSPQYTSQPQSQPASHYADHRSPHHSSYASPSIGTVPATNQYARTTPTTPAPNQYYYPLRPLGNHNALNTSYSSPPIPLYPTGTLGKHSKTRHHPAGDHLTDDCTSSSFRTQSPVAGEANRSEYLVDGGRGEQRSTRTPVPPSSLTSQYYPHTNLMPVQQSAIPVHVPMSPYSPTVHYTNHSSPVPMQPLRPNNLPYPSAPLHSSHPHNPQPLVPRSSTGKPANVPQYSRPTTDRESRDGQENLPPSNEERGATPTPTTPSRDCSQLSDKQILRARFAQRGVLLDRTERIGSGRYSKVMTAGLKDGSTIAIKIINTTRVTTEFRTKFLPREIECWEKLRHAHLIKLLYRDEIGGRVFLFMEYGPGGDMV